MKKLLFEVKEKEFNKLLEVNYAKSYDKDNIREMLLGVNFKCVYGIIETIALDGYRISKRVYKLNDESINFNFILDHDSVKILKREIKRSKNTIKIYSNENNIIIENETKNKTIKCKTIDQEFINCNSIIKDNINSRNDLQIKLDSKELLKHVKEIKKNENDLILLTITNDKLIIKNYNNNNYFHNYNNNKLKYEIEYKDIKNKTEENIFKIAVKSKYLYEALRIYKKDITLKFISSVKPITIYQEKENIDIILPVRMITNY